MLTGFAVKHGYLVLDPLGKIAAPHHVEADPTILTMEQCKTLLDVAENKWGGECFTLRLPRTDLRGIRPHELTKPTWGAFQ